ncbi:unnamed protein product [Trichogramma brassicae]|uniref:Uncharacterized protein n=1 Tax=Trichogramma brassicae TaxID=86971 RepID=A0A6H5IWQ1_9HYME|nr:unnamed protein product [Trichogramma brassicae]
MFTGMQTPITTVMDIKLYNTLNRCPSNSINNSGENKKRQKKIIGISERKMEISIDKLIFCYVTVYMCMLTKIKSNGIPRGSDIDSTWIEHGSCIESTYVSLVDIRKSSLIFYQSTRIYMEILVDSRLTHGDLRSNPRGYSIIHEVFCENNCTSEQFVCHEVINQCVPLNWICDGNADCFDGSDEIECKEIRVGLNEPQRLSVSGTIRGSEDLEPAVTIRASHQPIPGGCSFSAVSSTAGPSYNYCIVSMSGTLERATLS